VWRGNPRDCASVAYDRKFAYFAAWNGSCWGGNDVDMGTLYPVIGKNSEYYTVDCIEGSGFGWTVYKTSHHLEGIVL